MFSRVNLLWGSPGITKRVLDTLCVCLHVGLLKGEEGVWVGPRLRSRIWANVSVTHCPFFSSFLSLLPRSLPPIHNPFWPLSCVTFYFGHRTVLVINLALFLFAARLLQSRVIVPVYFHCCSHTFRRCTITTVTTNGAAFDIVWRISRNASHDVERSPVPSCGIEMRYNEAEYSQQTRNA